MNDSIRRSGKVVLAFVLAVIAAWGAVAAENSCCGTVGSDPLCSGCIKINDTPPEYVIAGERNLKKCRVSKQSGICMEEPLPCFVLDDADIYAPGCRIKIGNVTIRRDIMQCADGETPCGSG